MKVQRVNPNRMSQKDILSNKSMMSTANLIQKLGQGKRKYNVNLEKYHKKFLGTLAKEMKKQFISQGGGPQMKKSLLFFDYLKAESTNKNKKLNLSYEELEFLKMTMKESLGHFGTMEFKWWQFIKKLSMKMMLTQYKALFEALTK